MRGRGNAAPLRAFGGVRIPVTGSPPSTRRILPGLRLPLGRRRIAPGAGVSFLLHAALILFLVVRGRELLDTRARTQGWPGGGGGGGGGSGSGRREVNFFALPASGAPTAVELPAPPHVPVADLSLLQAVRLDLPRLELPAVAPALGTVAAATGAAATGSGQGPGGGAGVGPGAGPGAGSALGPGTGDAGSYIFVAAPRMAILPPLASVPRSVAGRTYRVRFWVGAEGRVTRIEVDPPIPDADYGREFRQRMMAYQFYPARTRDGRSVASVVTVPVRIGN